MLTKVSSTNLSHRVGGCEQELRALKQSVYNTLLHRAKIISSNQEALDQEILHIRRALQACQFPNWALNQLQHKFQRNNQSSLDNNHNSNSTDNNNTNSNNWNITIVVSYIQGTGENFKRFVSPKAYKYISRAPTLSEHY